MLFSALIQEQYAGNKDLLHSWTFLTVYINYLETMSSLLLLKPIANSCLWTKHLRKAVEANIDLLFFKKDLSRNSLMDSFSEYSLRALWVGDKEVSNTGIALPSHGLRSMNMMS